MRKAMRCAVYAALFFLPFISSHKGLVGAVANPLGQSAPTTQQPVS